MAHQIDTSNGQNNIAFVGKVPWHGLGQQLAGSETLETWKQKAGLEFSVKRSTVMFNPQDTDPTNVGQYLKYDNFHVLHRSDTGAALAVVSERYKIVQPGEVLDFFRDLTASAGFAIETAGALAGGRKVWALARVGEGANVIGQDTVRPYLLLATSFGDGMATTAKFTTVRVVCNNTLSMSINNEGDTTQGAVVNAVKIMHSQRYDPMAIKQRLGIITNAWDKFLVESRQLAHKELSSTAVDHLTYELLAPTVTVKPGQPVPDVRETRNYKRVMELFSGDATGAALTEGPTAWAWLNSVTEWVDHERGRSRDTGLTSAWFGTGNALKNRALELATAL